MATGFWFHVVGLDQGQGVNGLLFWANGAFDQPRVGFSQCKFFKTACPSARVYSNDHGSFTCASAAGYTITFCPTTTSSINPGNKHPADVDGHVSLNYEVITAVAALVFIFGVSIVCYINIGGRDAPAVSALVEFKMSLFKTRDPYQHVHLYWLQVTIPVVFMVQVLCSSIHKPIVEWTRRIN